CRPSLGGGGRADGEHCLNGQPPVRPSAGNEPWRIVRAGNSHDSPWPGMSHGESCELPARFRSYVIDYGRHTPERAGRTLGDGEWRELLYPSPSHWPACWIEQDRINYLSPHERGSFKFEGFGECCRVAASEAVVLA